MTGRVPHYRPELPTFDDMLSSRPVSASDWATLAYAANWAHGHGGQCVPWCAIGHEVASGSSATLTFRTTRKVQTVARVWSMNLLADTDGARATVTIGGTALGTVTPPTSRDGRRESFVFVEELSSQSGSTTTTTVAIAAAGGDITIESLGSYDQTRHELQLDSTDDGVNVNTLRARQPIVDFDYQSIPGVCDAEKALSARRLGHFAWAVPTSAAISPGSTSLVELFELPATVQAVRESTNTTENHAVFIYSKVSSGTGSVRVATAQGAHTTTMSITRTSFGWDSADTLIETEDLTTDTGQRSGEETITISAADPAGQTLSIASILVVRGGFAKV